VFSGHSHPCQLAEIITERAGEIKLQIIAIGAEIQICQAVIEAPKSPEELLKAQEELKGLAAELKSLQMQLFKVTHSSLG
jgi:hypothetical protein